MDYLYLVLHHIFVDWVKTFLQLVKGQLGVVQDDPYAYLLGSQIKVCVTSLLVDQSNFKMIPKIIWLPNREAM